MHLLVLGGGDAPQMQHLKSAPQGVRVTFANDRATAVASAKDADAILVWWTGAAELSAALDHGRRVAWVHSIADGLDGLVSPSLVEHPCTMTNTRGIYSRALAEFALSGMLFFAKDLARMRRAQARGAWEQFPVEELRNRTATFLGFGDIGRATARLARAFGMRVVAYRSSAQQDDLCDEVTTDLRRALSVADYVIAALPLTPQTCGLVNEEAIAWMKPTAVFINVGRGAVVDEQALACALREHRIKGAALDVFTQEPLPAGHAFYGMDHVLLSPHTADRTATWLDEAMGVFLENLARFRAGQPLANVVDKARGY